MENEGEETNVTDLEQLLIYQDEKQKKKAEYPLKEDIQKETTVTEEKMRKADELRNAEEKKNHENEKRNCEADKTPTPQEEDTECEIKINEDKQKKEGEEKMKEEKGKNEAEHKLIQEQNRKEAEQKLKKTEDKLRIEKEKTEAEDKVKKEKLLVEEYLKDILLHGIKRLPRNWHRRCEDVKKQADEKEKNGIENARLSAIEMRKTEIGKMKKEVDEKKTRKKIPTASEVKKEGDQA